MQEAFVRSALLLGEQNMEKLAGSHVAVFGVGGVGGFVVEGLARGGIGALDLIDNDEVCLSNLNRQIIALHSTIGMAKVDAAAARIADINPDCLVRRFKCFYLPETRAQFDFAGYDYIVDAIDTVTAKIDLILAAKEAGVPIISAMGCGNKLDPTQFEVADLSKTSMDPLARVLRRELKKHGVTHVKVVYSREPAIKPREAGRTPGSVSFVPSAAGLVIAGEVIKDLCYNEKQV